MSAFFDPAGPHHPSGADGDEQGFVDPSLEREEARRRWPVRAAAWRAAELAEAIFGGEVAARLSGAAGTGAFRGLVHLEVPFEGLDDHVERERIFTACAARDEVLARVPLVFVFAPRTP